ncbi:hypothetical protein OXPF_12190 [Oxobacter pfennigii]|uniref:Uncharacterized protein n=1 Tax=Oxobacter pfennigii TaxID=36849 RepID=A0A0P9AIN2_9CLOT|nr:hypothetical protein [Oxobacter pfennigii]KPU45326.1 hypothetical protein OXPF_12190 [Oxobacter pfennigii]
MQMEKQISRKDFVKGVGKTLAGAAVAGTLGPLLAGCAPTSTAADTTEKPQWPFPYKKVDVDKAAERAFHAYKEKGG